MASRCRLAVHDYRAFDFDIVEAIIRRGFPDFHELIRNALEKTRTGDPEQIMPNPEFPRLNLGTIVA
jgi:hypothetical protein